MEQKSQKETFVDFTVYGNGWSVTVTKRSNAERIYDGAESATLYGNTSNGAHQLIASK